MRLTKSGLRRACPAQLTFGSSLRAFDVAFCLSVRSGPSSRTSASDLYVYIYIYSLPGPAPTVRRPCLPSTGPVLKPPAPLSNTYQSAACVREEKRLEQLATPSVESGFAAEEPKGQSASIRRILKAIIPEPLNGNRGPFHVLQHALDVDVLQYLRSAPYFRRVVCSSWTLPTENGTKQEHLYHTVHGDKVPGSNRLQKSAFGLGQVCL